MFGLALIGGGLGILGYFKKQYTPSELAAIKSDVEILKKQVGLFWGVVEKQMSQLLHSPHRHTLDRLLDKNSAGDRLTDREAEQLIDLLQKLIDSKDISGDEVAYATMLMAVTAAKYGIET